MDWLHGKKIRLIRWILFFLIILGVLVGLSFDLWQTCTDSVIDGKVHQICGSASIAEPRIILLILLAVMVLLPDMNEVGIFGLLLKRRVEEAERQVAELRQEIKIEAVSQSSATAVTLLVTPDSIKDSQNELRENRPKFLAGEEVQHTRTGPDKPNLDLAWELISNTEALNEALGLGIYRRAFSDGAQSRYKQYVARFRSDFADQIEIVTSARNTVAHARYIPDEALENAVSLSRELLKMNRDGLQKFREAL